MTGDEMIRRLAPLERRLENGLTLLVREDRSAPVTAIVTRVEAGYFDEPDELVGVSHVLEHMFFKGTRRRGAGEIARATKAAGGYLNAGTIYDHTSYYTVVPSASTELALELQADALQDSLIDAGELEREIAVITEEVKRKLDNPSALTVEKLYEAMFDAHPIRRWRMGTEEGLRRLRRADVVAYYRRMYRGPNTIVAIAGDVDADAIAARVEALYGSVSGELPDRPPRPREPERTGGRYRELSGDIGHTHAALGWRTPGALHADSPALDALALVLGEGRGARLYRNVRERGLASAVDAYNYTPTEIGAFLVRLECEPERAPDALGAAWAEVDRIRRGDVATDDLERVRTLLRARLLRRLETVEGQANLLADWQALGDWRLAADYVQRIESVTPAELARVAGRHLRPDATTAVVHRPASARPLGWDGATLPERLATGAAERPAPGAAASRAHGPPPVVEYDLGHARLVAMHRPRTPLVSMAVARRGGGLHETASRAGITRLMMRASVKGAGTRSASEIALASERLGGGILATAGPDLVSWGITLPSEHFEAGLGLLADVALRPSFPAPEVERERDVLLADMERLRDDMYRYPVRLLLRAAFGDHPYGHLPEEIVGAVAGVDAAAVRAWHAGELGPPRIFVVGDVEPERAAAGVAARFADADGAVSLREPPPARPGEGRVREVRRDRAQTAVAVGFPGPTRTDPDRVTVDLLARAVSGLGNRLFEELRSRRSLAYTVSAAPVVRRAAGLIVGYIATSVDRGDEARAALIAELERLRSAPPTEEELERARRYTIGSWQIRSQANSALLSELAGAVMLGEGAAELDAFEGRVRATTRDHVAAAAARWIDPDRMAEGAVRGAVRGADRKAD